MRGVLQPEGVCYTYATRVLYIRRMSITVKQVNYRLPVDLVDALKAASVGHKSETEFVIKALRVACGLDDGAAIQGKAPAIQVPAVTHAPVVTHQASTTPKASELAAEARQERTQDHERLPPRNRAGHKWGCTCMVCKPPKPA